MTFATAVFDDASLRDRVLEVVGDVLPFVSPDMQESLAPISGSPLAVAAGVVVALWGGLNAMRVAQDTMNRMWGVPRYRRPGLVRAVGHGSVVLLLLGSVSWGLRSSPG